MDDTDRERQEGEQSPAADGSQTEGAVGDGGRESGPIGATSSSFGEGEEPPPEADPPIIVQGG